MWDTERMLGHAVEATIEFEPRAVEGRRIPPLAPGNRSLVYQFDSLTNPGTDTGFEGMIEWAETRGNDETVQIRFLRANATIYATEGVCFKVWYGGVIGTGVVLRVVE